MTWVVVVAMVDGPVRYTVDTPRSSELIAWLGCNDIDPRNVPYPSKVTVETDDGVHWVIRYDTYARSANGTIAVDRKTLAFGYAEVRVDLVTDPPMWWLTETAPSDLQGTEGAVGLLKPSASSEDNLPDGACNCD